MSLPENAQRSAGSRRLDAAVFVAGAALMGLEIAGSRVLAPVFGTSIFVWGSLITTFLASLAVGYWAGGRLADRRPEPALLATLLAAAGVILWGLFASPAWLLAISASAPLPDRFRSLVASLVLFAPPSVLMGMVTPFAVKLAARDLLRIGSAAGRLSAVSTAGSILGTFAMAFFLIPTFATRPIMYGLGVSLVAASVLVPGPFALWRFARGALLAGAGALLFLFAPVETPSPIPGGTVVFEKETAYHHLRVVDAGARRSLFFNNANQGFVDPRPGHEPPPNYTDGMAMALAFRDRPLGEALAIGLGTGLVPSLVARRSPETSMTTIEIDTEHARLLIRGDLTVVYADGRTEVVEERRATSTGRAYWGVSHELLVADFYRTLEDPEPFWIGPTEGLAALAVLDQVYRDAGVLADLSA